MTLPTGKRRPRGQGKLKRDAAGFTLIEVLLSVVILSAGLVAVDQILLRLAGHTGYLEHRGEASRLAANKKWEAEQEAEKKGSAPTGQGVLLGARKAFSYQLKSKGVEGQAGLLEMELAVGWEESGIKKDIHRTFYLSLPDEAAAL